MAARMVRAAKDWGWNSHRATAGLLACESWLTVDWLLRGFGDNRNEATQRYRRFIREGKNQASVWEGLKNQIYLGSELFVEEMQCLIEPGQSLDNVPKPQKGLVKKPLSEYERGSHSRNEMMALAYRRGCYTLKEIGEHFGVSHTTVSRAVKTFEKTSVQCEN